MTKGSYFTEAGPVKITFYAVSVLALVTYSFVAVFELFYAPECNDKPWNLKYPNPEYRKQPCHWHRYPQLVGLNRMECEWARRLLVAGLLGSAIGFERRSPDRPAGIRTMVTVSVGAALFTLNSMFAFLSGPMEWDSSRVSAALPSGVGFLGAAVIWKQTTEDGRQNINGVTTAASVWLSAAVGTAAGGGLYISALFTVLITINLLRFGPRMDRKDDEEEEDEDEDEGEVTKVDVDISHLQGSNRLSGPEGPAIPPIDAAPGSSDMTRGSTHLAHVSQTPMPLGSQRQWGTGMVRGESYGTFTARQRREKQKREAQYAS
eukprot:Hpha_TRINITY_DN16514_c1_g5::TRINITY_DN16514_c1_g5_i1::g.134012::m.134012/K07507/mgtC; putative Mg2+ transporter-C (MgtC) family protein